MHRGRFACLAAVLIVLSSGWPSFGGGSRLESLPAGMRPVGTTPVPTARAYAKYRKYLDKPLEPELTLEVRRGRPRLLPLKSRPFRIQVGNTRILGYSLVEDRLLALEGRRAGITLLNLWFGDPKNPVKQSVVRLQINVL
jgi:hypothetical protein